MKKFILLFIILTLFLFLSGCGLYNLNYFVLPDDAEFLTLIQELDTPQKIGTYMLLNFTYEYHPHGLLAPYRLYLYKKGDCNDFSNFGTYIAHCNGYKVWQIKIKFKNNNISHFLGVYKKGDYLTYTDNRNYCINYYDNFIDIVNIYCLVKDKPWTKYTVYDYDMNIIEIIYDNYSPRFNI